MEDRGSYYYIPKGYAYMITFIARARGQLGMPDLNVKELTYALFRTSENNPSRVAQYQGCDFCKYRNRGNMYYVKEVHDYLEQRTGEMIGYVNDYRKKHEHDNDPKPTKNQPTVEYPTRSKYSDTPDYPTKTIIADTSNMQQASDELLKNDDVWTD